MTAPEGFILLHKKMLEWEWYDDGNTMRVFLHFMLKANYKDAKWRGHEIKRGQFISTPKKVSEDLALSVKQVRTAISKLERTGETASKGSTQHTVFTVINYDDYQPRGEQEGRQKEGKKENEGQAEGDQRATANKDNNKNNNTKPKKPATPKKRIDENLVLSQEWGDSAVNYWNSKNRFDLSPVDEFETFMAHHLAQATTSTNFKHNWKTWYTNALKYNRGNHGTNQPPPRPTSGNGQQPTSEGFAADAIAEAERLQGLRFQ